MLSLKPQTNPNPVHLGFEAADITPDLRTQLKAIVEGGGYLQQEDLETLAEQLPGAIVVIKWGASPRSVINAKDALLTIRALEAAKTDYVREVFFSAGNCDKIRSLLA